MDSNESRLREGPDRLARWVILAEGMDRRSVEAACMRHMKPSALVTAGAERDLTRRTYRLALSVAKDRSDSLDFARDPARLHPRPRALAK